MNIKRGSIGNSAASFAKEASLQHGSKLLDIKEQLGPLIEPQKGVSESKYHSKFRRSGVPLNNGVYDN